MAFVLRYLPAIIIILMMVYAIVDVAQTDEDRIKHMPRWMWIVVILFFPGFGAAAWLLFGKRRGGSSPARPKAPDDDPDFLRGLKPGGK